MKKLLLLLLLSLGFIGSAYADAICNDGWISKSSGSGTCSWHGGVLMWLDENWLDENIDSFGGDGFYWPDDKFFDPCEKQNRIRGQTREECEQSPFSSLNRFKRVIENSQNSDKSMENLIQIIQNSK